MKTKFILALLVPTLGSSCAQKAAFDDSWTRPQTFGESGSGLVSSLALYNWNGTLLARRGNDSTKADVYDGFTGLWNEVSLPQVGTLIATAATGQHLLLVDGAVSEKLLDLTFSVYDLDVKLGLGTLHQRKLMSEATAIFHGLAPNQRLCNPLTRPFFPDVGPGSIDGTAVYVPYCLRGETYHGNTVVTREGPFANGFFFGERFGAAWQREHVGSLFAGFPTIVRTTEFLYYFAARYDSYDLASARKSTKESKWESLETIVKSCVIASPYRKDVAKSESSTVHLTWLDMRHEKKRLNPVYPFRENYEIVYSRRKDSDQTWSKNVILSKGLLYSYSPALAVEGEKVIVVWSGAEQAKDGQIEDDAKDIYYATSKDGGTTWAPPLRVTDNLASGMSAGKPEVGLHQGKIHLLYIQGKLQFSQISPGMTKINQPPWPIYYQQRAFPD